MLTKLTGGLLILLPIAFNVVFAMLQRAFEYPDILRKPTDHILRRFQAGGGRLVGTWYAFMLTSVLVIPMAILTPQVIAPNEGLYVVLATTLGVLAGLVQVMGLIRWPFVVPYLAQTYTDPAASPATRDSVAVTFQAIHRYAGVALGEHLGYFFTSLWTATIALGLTHATVAPAWLGWLGLIPAVGIFVGLFEEAGFKPAAAINAISYILWSVWLIAVGITFLLV